MTSNVNEEEVNSTVIAAIVVGSVGVVMMTLGSLLYFTRLGDVPSRRAVGSEPEKDIENGEETVKKHVKQGTSGEGGGDDAPPLSNEQETQVTSIHTARPGEAETASASIATAAVPNPPSSGSDNATATLAADSNLPLTSTNQNSTREELIEVYVPAGKLGFTLEDTSQQQQQGETPGGPPIVHEVRETSILKSTLQAGDRLIALDDEDVRQMSAQQVSKMISRKFDSTTRKLSIVRTVPVVPDGSV